MHEQVPAPAAARPTAHRLILHRLSSAARAWATPSAGRPAARKGSSSWMVPQSCNVSAVGRNVRHRTHAKAPARSSKLYWPVLPVPF